MPDDPPSRLPLWPFVVVAAGAILLGSIFLFRAHPIVSAVPLYGEGPAAVVDKASRSVAVLPFSDTSGGRTEGGFAEQFNRGVVAELARVPGLRVASGASVEAYVRTPSSAQEIGRGLGVAYVLKGSARTAGSRAYVTAQFINAATGEFLWVRYFDRDQADPVTIQSELAREVAGTLSVALPATARPGTSDSQHPDSKAPVSR